MGVAPHPTERRPGLAGVAAGLASSARLLLAGLALAGLLLAVGSPLGAQSTGSLQASPTADTPIEAIFFDLGNTVFYRPEGAPAPGCPFPKLRAFDDAEATFEALAKRGIRLGVITSVPDSWTLDTLNDCLERPEILDVFEVVVLSSQAPGDKPDPAIYTHAMQQLAQPPPAGHIAFVTEEAEDLAGTAEGQPVGAQAVGMIGVLKAKEPVEGIDAHIVDLADLLDFLDHRKMMARP